VPRDDAAQRLGRKQLRGHAAGQIRVDLAEPDPERVLWIGEQARERPSPDPARRIEQRPLDQRGAEVGEQRGEPLRPPPGGLRLVEGAPRVEDARMRAQPGR
jgi:hypothetical protein